MYKPKYKKGKKITSFKMLMKHLDEDNFVYLRRKIQHKGWVLSLQFRCVVSALKCGNIRVALKIK